MISYTLQIIFFNSTNKCEVFNNNYFCIQFCTDSLYLQRVSFFFSFFFWSVNLIYHKRDKPGLNPARSKDV